MGYIFEFFDTEQIGDFGGKRFMGLKDNRLIGMMRGQWMILCQWMISTQRMTSSQLMMSRYWKVRNW